jgi:hypothetical protein
MWSAEYAGAGVRSQEKTARGARRRFATSGSLRLEVSLERREIEYSADRPPMKQGEFGSLVRQGAAVRY